MGQIHLQSVTKSFGEVNVIPPLDLKINDGEFVVFVGPSGCGKSTLLRLVAGLEDITSGRMMFDGEEVNDLPPAERGIAMVFQSYALYPNMNVEQNISFGMEMRGVPKTERARAVADVAARTRGYRYYLHHYGPRGYLHRLGQWRRHRSCTSSAMEKVKKQLFSFPGSAAPSA